MVTQFGTNPHDRDKECDTYRCVPICPATESEFKPDIELISAVSAAEPVGQAFSESNMPTITVSSGAPAAASPPIWRNEPAAAQPEPQGARSMYSAPDNIQRCPECKMPLSWTPECHLPQCSIRELCETNLRSNGWTNADDALAQRR